MKKLTLNATSQVCRKTLVPAACAAALSTLAGAQGFGNEWVEFDQDNSKLVAGNSVGLGDTQEKDYMQGDLDNDGWTDLVCVRKQPFTTPGRRTNVLFMNEGGTLVDRTSQYATASTVGGDQGFLTETNDRDVAIVDLDLDGWLDVVTCTTLTSGQPKHISHPRVYMNLGNNGSGNWQGLRFENSRFPQLHLSNGNPSFPMFCSVDAGDVTGDGFPDLYFGDYDSNTPAGGGDMNDRLLINDGNGNFTDESFARMTSQMLSSAFGNSVAIHDMNLDGVNDIVKDTSLNAPQYVAVSYNDPGNEGVFDVFDSFHDFAPYHVNIGDLNNDGRTDVVITDDGDDRYRYNLSTDTFGRVVWGSAKTFDFLWDGDDGFGSDNYIVDLDEDGWADVLICDVDVDISGCNRRAHIYHNPGGNIGQQITLREEAQQSGNNGWKGVAGILASDLQGMHDICTFDIDNDGDKDMVFGRCSGTDVWFNTLDPVPDTVGTPVCFCDGNGTAAPCGNTGGSDEGCANSTGSGATLGGVGSNSAWDDDLVMEGGGMLPSQPALLFVGNNTLNGGNGVPFGDGLRCAGGSVVRLGVKIPNSAGSATRGPGRGATRGWGTGDTRTLQGWYRDPSGSPCSNGFNLTGAVEVTFSL
ncbi:MAG: VCBS repeat-containing protein [Planctomycetota bacterium]|nr:VCBS repeat-containing protein [Planctomycetota bacterium]